MTDRKGRDYVALMSYSAGDEWLPTATSQVSAWLREKNFDVNLLVWEDYEHGGNRLSVRPMPFHKGSDLVVRLSEPSSQGVWSTELVLHDEPRSSDWVSLTIANDQGRFVDVPRLARYLIQVLPLGDGQIVFTDGPQILGEQDVDHLVSLLADEARHGLVFVAGTAAQDIPFGPFVQKVGVWAKQVYGLAQVVVLDPAATSALRHRVGPDFAAPPWTIRTYQPGVTFHQQHDARRHRVLGTRTLGLKSDRAISFLLGDVARQQAVIRPSDASLLRVHRRLERLETARLVDAVAPASEALPVGEPIADVHVLQEPSTSAPEPIEAKAYVDPELLLARRVLGLDVLTEEALQSLLDRARRPESDPAAQRALRARVEALQSAMENAEDELAAAIESLSDAQLEVEISQLDVEARDAKIRWLESRLTQGAG